MLKIGKTAYRIGHSRLPAGITASYEQWSSTCRHDNEHWWWSHSSVIFNEYERLFDPVDQSSFIQCGFGLC